MRCREVRASESQKRRRRRSEGRGGKEEGEEESRVYKEGGQRGEGEHCPCQRRCPEYEEEDEDMRSVT